MVKTASPQTELFDSIMASPISAQEKIQKVNQAIQDFNIKTPKLVYSDINNTDTLEETRKAFEQKQTYVDAQTLATENYKKERLLQDAVINIDLENLDRVINAGKIRVSLEGMTFITQTEVKYENLTDIEEELNNVAIELYKDYVGNASTKYLNSKGDIIEDVHYTNVFDDNEVVETDSHIKKVANISILAEALSQKLPKTLETIIGAQKIKEIKRLLKQREFIKSQISPSQALKASGNKNSKC
jgi:hypothetical protein